MKQAVTGRYQDQIMSVVFLALLLFVGAFYSVPARGASSDLSDFDQLMQSLLSKYNVPGGALAVSKDGRLVYAKGFGLADQKSREPVSNKTLFRISSVSKPIAAVAILKLVEQGKLQLSDKPYKILGALPQPADRAINPQVASITVLDLLRHTSGHSSRNASGRISSPMQPPISRQISREFDVPHPPAFKYVAGYMQTQTLIGRPGSRFEYSNYGYALLGALVEKVTGQPFERYVQQNILNPIGNTCMRFGKTLRHDKAPNEAMYYDLDNASLVRSVFDGETSDTFPYAGRDYAGWGAAGAWIASPVEVVRFVNHVDGLRRPALLRSSSVKKMLQKNAVSERKTGFWYGLGWRVQDKKVGQHWYHDGASNSGAAAIMMRTNTGLVWSASFNKRLPAGRALYKEFNKKMWSITRGVTRWPSGDLFDDTRCQ